MASTRTTRRDAAAAREAVVADASASALLSLPLRAAALSWGLTTLPLTVALRLGGRVTRSLDVALALCGLTRTGRAAAAALATEGALRTQLRHSAARLKARRGACACARVRACVCTLPHGGV